MSSASLAVARRPHPDSARIAAISVAIALNLAALVIASRPITPAQLAVVRQLAPAQLIRLIEPPVKLPPPPTIELKPLSHPSALPQTRVKPVTVAVSVVVPSKEGQLVAPTVTAPTIAPKNTLPGTATAPVPVPVEASLAYRSAPLHFPIQAMRQHMQGTVLLRVLVDETGKPLDVLVEHSSGFTLLDSSARQQVLAAWRFQPAMVNGQAVRAWARVPVSFNLREE
jgi:protein TonB